MREVNSDPNEDPEGPSRLNQTADIADDDSEPQPAGAEEQPSIDTTGDPLSTDPVDRFSRVRRSVGGMMLTSIAIGLQDALELQRNEPPFVIKAASDPNSPQGPIDLHFDPDDPTNTVAIIRHQPVESPPDSTART
jgi:hypothetical protein